LHAEKNARRHNLKAETDERKRRDAKIAAEESAEVYDAWPNIFSFTAVFRIQLDELPENENRWKSYTAMVFYLEQIYGARPKNGWIQGPPNVWSAPSDETWRPRVTPSIRDIKDVEDFAHQAKDHRRRCYDAVDAWTRWFYPLKHFFYEENDLDDGVEKSDGTDADDKAVDGANAGDDADVDAIAGSRSAIPSQGNMLAPDDAVPNYEGGEEEEEANDLDDGLEKSDGTDAGANADAGAVVGAIDPSPPFDNRPNCEC